MRVAVGVRVGVRVAVAACANTIAGGAAGAIITFGTWENGMAADGTVKPAIAKGEAPIAAVCKVGKFSVESETEVATANNGDIADSFAATSFPRPEREAKAGISVEP